MQNFGGVKLCRIDSFKSFGKENVGECTITNISYYSEPGIWLGKILVNGIRFAKVPPTKILHCAVVECVKPHTSKPTLILYALSSINP